MTCLATEENVAEVSSVHAEIRVETIAGYQEFPGLEPVWNEAAKAAGLDHLWECFGAGSTLQILVLKAGDQPIATAPLIRAEFFIAQRPEGLDRLRNSAIRDANLRTDVQSLALQLLQ
jgi:hypothetical protein